MSVVSDTERLHVTCLALILLHKARNITPTGSKHILALRLTFRADRVMGLVRMRPGVSVRQFFSCPDGGLLVKLLHAIRLTGADKSLTAGVPPKRTNDGRRGTWQREMAAVRWIKEMVHENQHN